MTQETRTKVKRLHAMSGGLALLIISTFFTTTIISELSGDTALIAAVKQGIAYGLLLLVPAMAAVGLSGRRLAGSSTAEIIQRKQRRMAVIAANGLLVLLPCALTLAWLASTGASGSLFYAVQGIELLAGGVNITLLVLNIRLGLQMTRRRAQA
jgi:hypothetical protein